MRSSKDFPCGSERMVSMVVHSISGKALVSSLLVSTHLLKRRWKGPPVRASAVERIPAVDEVLAPALDGVVIELGQSPQLVEL